MSKILCPKCGSDQLSANKKGFSGVKAFAGVVTVGAIGTLAGTTGSNKIRITCLSCGHVFKPGQGAKSIEEVERNKRQKTKVTIITISVLIVLGVIGFIQDKLNTPEAPPPLTKEEKAKFDKENDYLNFWSEKQVQATLWIEEGLNAEEVEERMSNQTKDLLKNRNDSILEWLCTVISVDEFKDKELDVSFSVVKEKLVKNSKYTLEVMQASSEKYGFKGLNRQSELGQTVRNLSPGEKVKISGKIVGSFDNCDGSKKYISTLLQIELSEIKK